MKTIKCGKCGKDVQVEEGYFNKCCPICLAKRKSDYAVENAERDFERESEKQLKSLFGENPPANLSYSRMKQWYESHGKELTWEQYLKNLQQAAIHKIQADGDSRVRELKGEKSKRIRYNAKFLNFELYPPSSREECKKFRHQAMGSYPKNQTFMEEHLAECFECRMWNDVKESGCLNAEGSCEVWNEEPQPAYTEEKAPPTFEEWETQQGLEPLDKDLLKHLADSYRGQNEPSE